MYSPGMSEVSRGSGISRETRLLLLTLVVSAGVLFLLARFRFPDQPTTESPVPQPLERLAARATFDELASIVGQLEARVTPSLVVLRVSSASASPAFTPGFRIRDDVAVTLLDPEQQVQGLIGDAEAVPVILAADPVRRIALVRVPSRPSPYVPVGGWDGALSTPSYVAVAEGTRGGATLRPLFLGRTDPFMESRWDKPLLALGGTASAEPGSFVFHLDGHLTGMVVDTEGGLALVPASALLEAGNQLFQGGARDAGDLGIEVQALSAVLATAAQAQYGSMVTYVDPLGPAKGALQVGDVIDAIDGDAVYSVDSLSIRIARTRPGSTVRARVTRFGHQLEVSLVARARPSSEGSAPTLLLGLTLRAIAGIGAEVVRVESQSAAARAGLLPGDIITQVVDRRAPLPRDVTQAFAAAAAKSTLLLGIDRQGKHHVTALEKSS